MSSRLPKHLTDEQFSDLLASESPSDAVQEHLAACEHCRGELAAVLGTVSSFNVFSLTWAQRESARRVKTPSRWTLQVASMPTWAVAIASVGAAFLLAMGLGLPFGHEPEPTTEAIVIPVPSDAEIARDNKLLASIDQELQYRADLAVPAAELIVSTPRQRQLEAVVSN